MSDLFRRARLNAAMPRMVGTCDHCKRSGVLVRGVHPEAREVLTWLLGQLPGGYEQDQVPQVLALGEAVELEAGLVAAGVELEDPQPLGHRALGVAELLLAQLGALLEHFDTDATRLCVDSVACCDAWQLADMATPRDVFGCRIKVGPVCEGVDGRRCSACEAKRGGAA